MLRDHKVLQDQEVIQVLKEPQDQRVRVVVRVPQVPKVLQVQVELRVLKDQ